MEAKRRRGKRPQYRRGAVIVQVAMFSTVMVGMGALAVDIGAMYSARTELQAAVDASALAAAAQLGGDGVSSPEAAAATADQYARLNSVFGTHAGLGDQDIEFGRAELDESGKFHFASANSNYDAVRITVRREEGSEGGPLNLMFSHLFGYSTKALGARSAVLVPRDIAVVIDLSGSMNDDSELRHYRHFTGDQGQAREGVQVNLRDCWAALNGPAPQRPYMPGGEMETEYAGDTGPNVGAMTLWGNEVVVESYNPVNDPGLWYIPKGSTCTAAGASTSLASRGYTADERTVLMSGNRDGSYTNNWQNRTGVILGLAGWKSGRPGGAPGGNGNDIVENNEVTWIGYPSYRSGGWTWTNYLSYVSGTGSTMYQTQPSFRYRYGLKTFTNYLLENYAAYNQTNTLWQTPEQPLRAVKDAVQVMVEYINGLDSNDHMSLEIFAQSARHEVDLTDNLQSVSERLYHMQSGHYDSTTNIGAGIAYAQDELSSSRARDVARKMIVMMSDGKPNTNENNQYVGDTNPAAAAYAVAMAQSAADDHMIIYTISVGVDADLDLMQQIANIGHGQHFHAEGTPEEYQAQLEQIFRSLGGKRPVALIE